MLGLDGSKMYARFDYKIIIPQKQYSGADYFCDEHGKPDNRFSFYELGK